MWLAIRYRRLQALVLLVLAALITACAVLAPVYDRAMLQALTRLTLDAAPVSATSVRLESVATPADDPAAPVRLPATHEELAGLLPAEARGWFAAPVAGTSLFVTRADRTTRSPTGPLEWRAGACDHLDWVAGGCPARSGDVAVSAADAANFGLRPGSALDVVEQVAGDPPGPLPTVRLRVTGVYRQVPAPYWNDQVLTGVSGIVDTRPPYRPAHDTWLTARETFAAEPGRWKDPVNTVTYPMDRPAVGADEIRRAGPIVAGIAARSRVAVDDLGNAVADPDQMQASVRSDLPRIGATVDDGRRQALVTVPVVMIQLGLLALFVLGLMLAAAVEQRRPEVAVARLRGARRPEARRLVLAELLPVVLAGVPLGVAAALAAAAVARRTTLRGAAPFELGTGFWLAIGCAVLLLTAVTWAAAAAGTRDRIVALLRRVPTRSRGWRFGAADAVVIAAAGTAVAAFATGGLRGPLALAAPALLALLAGLLLAHLIVPVATWLARRLTARGAYAAALALLGVARRPVTRRIFTVVTVASALLVFAAYAVTVGARNRDLAAQRDVGAALVADVTGTDVARLRAALDRLGEGRVTPVVRIRAGDEGFRTTLAVDPEPFGRIALFPGADGAAVPWSGLRVPTGRRLALTGTAVSLRVTPAGFRTSTGQPVPLQLRLVDAAGTERTAVLGPIPADRPATLGAAVPCAAGCSVLGFGVAAGYGISFSGQLTLDRVRAVGGGTDLPGTAADWRTGAAQGRNAIEAAAAPAGALALRLESDGNGTPTLVSRYFPAALPAVTAGPNPAGGTVLGDGLNGASRTLAGIAGLPRAPGVEGAGAIVDLDTLQHWGSRTGRTARIEVWSGTEDPAVLDRVRTAVRDAGLELGTVRRLSEVRGAYDASVPAWSLQLGVLAAVAGLLLAGLVLVLLAASTGRLRSRDLACLGLSGVPRRALGRVAVGEQLPIVLLAVLAGAGCGLLGAALALPTVPLFARAQPAGLLDLSAPWGRVLAVLLATLLVLGTVAWLCGRAVAARARPARVREAL